MLGGDALLVEGVETIDFVFLVAYAKGGTAAKTIHR